MIAAYLSLEHRDRAGEGCPSAALLDEITRASRATREVFTTTLLTVVDALVARLAESPGAEPARGRSQVLSAYAVMIGTIQLSRAVADDQLSREVVERGLENVLAILGLEAPAT